MTILQPIEPQPSFLSSPQLIDFEKLLGKAPFVIFKGQILFRNKTGQVVMTQIDNDRYTYTAEHYQNLPEGAPYQLVKGNLIYMPSPFESHQKVSVNLTTILNIYVKTHKLGIVRHAPLDVYFDRENVYQPDLIFIAKDRRHIVGKFIQGAPDLVVEILSAGTQKIDETDKMEIYSQNGVKEYWIIHPDQRYLSQWLAENDKLILKKTYYSEETVHTPTIAGLTFPLASLFEE